MYFVVAGAGEVGFHLSQALLESGHEVTVIEADRRRANFVQERLGSIVMNAPADEGRARMEAGCSRADALIEAELAIGTPPAGKTVGSLRLPTDALVGGIIRKGKLLHADDETKLEVGDRVMVFAPTASESEVRKALFG